MIFFFLPAGSGSKIYFIIIGIIIPFLGIIVSKVKSGYFFSMGQGWVRLVGLPSLFIYFISYLIHVFDVNTKTYIIELFIYFNERKPF